MDTALLRPARMMELAGVTQDGLDKIVAFEKADDARIKAEQDARRRSTQTGSLVQAQVQTGYTSDQPDAPPTPANLADRITVQPAERDEGKFTNGTKRTEEAAKQQATTAALRRDVASERHWTFRLGEWCITDTTKFLLIAVAGFWCVVLFGVAVDVFLQVARHFWHPVGHMVDLAIAGAGEWWVR